LLAARINLLKATQVRDHRRCPLAWSIGQFFVVLSKR
jgi:hypothetical protein